MNIGNNIKKRREELGMSQDTLARLVGYKSRSAVNKIELGVNELKQKKIVEFANALNTTPADLMGWETENPPAIAGEGKDPLDARLNELLALADDNLKRSMISLLEQFLNK